MRSHISVQKGAICAQRVLDDVEHMPWQKACVVCLLCFQALKELLLQGVTKYKGCLYLPPYSQGSLNILYVPWQASARQVDMGAGEQRTAEWHAERDKRLTASAFGNALGCDTSMCLYQF